MRAKSRSVVFVLIAAALSVAAAAFVLRSRRAEPGAAPSSTARARAPAARSAPVRAAVDPCAHHRPANKKLGWVCRDDRAPVDLVNEQSMLMSVLHVPTPVLVLETERLDPSIPVVDPKRPPQAVCVLKGPATGLAGYVSWAALHDEPCRRDR